MLYVACRLQRGFSRRDQEQRGRVGGAWTLRSVLTYDTNLDIVGILHASLF